MTRYARFFSLILISLSTLLTACGGGSNSNGTEQPTDNMTSGEISISVDQTFQPILEAELESFHNIYQYAKVNAEYKSEAEAFNSLLDQSSRLIVASRALNDEERKVFESWKIVPKEILLAYDAVAFVINPENTDSSLSEVNMMKILTGEAKNWSDLYENSPLKGKNSDKITLVFDHPGSSTVRYIRDSVLQGKALTEDVFSANGNAEVIDYVAENKGAIGIIGVNWVSDRDSQEIQGFLRKVTVMELQAPYTSVRPGQYFQPYQGYIKMGVYPLIRPIYALSWEPRNGLGTGFAHFCAGEKGQRVILKSGLLPANIPFRVVEFPPKEGSTDIDDYINEQRNAELENE